MLSFGMCRQDISQVLFDHLFGRKEMMNIVQNDECKGLGCDIPCKISQSTYPSNVCNDKHGSMKPSFGVGGLHSGGSGLDKKSASMLCGVPC